jgi:hypothetical protein
LYIGTHQLESGNIVLQTIVPAILSDARHVSHARTARRSIRRRRKQVGYECPRNVFAAMNSRRFIIRSGDRQLPRGVARRSVDGYQKRFDRFHLIAASEPAQCGARLYRQMHSSRRNRDLRPPAVLGRHARIREDR